MTQVRDWKIIHRWEQDVLSSKKAIGYFQGNIIENKRKNNESHSLINEKREILTLLMKSFEVKNNISFFQAKKLVESTFNPESKYNLKDYYQIENIIQQINAEKFFINQRLSIIEKNKIFIDDTTKWIIEMENQIEKFK